MAMANSNEHVKRNAIDFKEEKKEKSYKVRTTLRMNGMIHRMYTDGRIMEELVPMINFARLLNDDTDDFYDSQNSATLYEI